MISSSILFRVYLCQITNITKKKNNFSVVAVFWSGANRARTDDLRLARAALSQLSYSPQSRYLVGLTGIEPVTSRLSGVRSNQLSYRPKVNHSPSLKAEL